MSTLLKPFNLTATQSSASIEGFYDGSVCVNVFFDYGGTGGIGTVSIWTEN